MGNIKNYTFDRLDFKLSNSDYWDFYLNTDAIKDTAHYDTNLIASFNFSAYTQGALGPDFFDIDFLTGDFNKKIGILFGIISDVKWDGAYSSSFNASTFGLTGLDNGCVPYDESLDDELHTELLRALTGTTLSHASLGNKMTLKPVSGGTNQIVYPLDMVINSGNTTNYVKLCGGFFQGYYKLDGYDYQVLPTRYQKGFTISTWLRPSACIVSGTTLNDLYENNKGFFYYTGTRAENKFWNIFSGNTSSGCTSGSTDFCMDVKETDVTLNNIIVGNDYTDISVPLSPPPIDLTLITNKFLLFGRSSGKVCGNTDSKDGFGQIRASDYDRNDKHYAKIVRQEQTDFQNQFLTFGRSSGKVCGNTDSEDGFGQVRASDYSGSTQDVMELDKDADIIDNAIGFRIKDDGSIGYRLLTVSGDCKSVEIIEEYSASGIVTSDQWHNVVVKWVNQNTYDECDLITGGPRRGRYKFYVDSNLIFVSKELDEFIPKRLYEIQEKQIGVPFNMSIGGGTQGLIDSMTFDGQDPSDLGLIIEQNFAGSFIGDMLSFDLYDKNLSWCAIKDIYNSRTL